MLDLLCLTLILLDEIWFYLLLPTAAGMDILYCQIFFFFNSSLTTCTIISPPNSELYNSFSCLFLFEAHFFVGVLTHTDWIEIYQMFPSFASNLYWALLKRK